VTSICHYDDVDPVLNGILHAPQGLSSLPSSTQAALSLLDEPNATDAVAEEIVDSFVEACTSESQGSLGLKVREVITELTLTRYSGYLLRRMSEEYCKAPIDSIERIGSLLSIAADSLIPSEEQAIDDWLVESDNHIREADDSTAALTALAIMHYAYGDGSYHSNGVTSKRPSKAVIDVAAALVSRLREAVPLRFAAIWALGWLSSNHRWRPTPSEVSILLDLAGSLSLPSERFWFGTIFRSSKIHEALPILRSWATDQNPRIAIRAAEALGVMKDPYATIPLRAAIVNAPAAGAARRARSVHFSQEIGLVAGQALGRLGTAASLTALFELVEQGYFDEAFSGLVESNDPAAMEALTRAIEQPNQKQQLAAIAALRRADSVRARAMLSTVLDSGADADVLGSAISVLAEVGGGKKALERYVDDSRPQVAALARAALERSE
jgi:HEAT repeat protein